MRPRRAVDWQVIWLRALIVLFGLLIILTGIEPVTVRPLLGAAGLLLALLGAGVLGALPAWPRTALPMSAYAGTVLELAAVTLLVGITGGPASIFYLFYVPVLILGTAGRGLMAGVMWGWLAAVGYAAASIQMSFSAESFPRAALLLLAGALIGTIEQRRAEADAEAVRGAADLTRRAQVLEQARAAVLEMGPLDLEGRARRLLEWSARLAGADRGLVAVLDLERRPMVAASLRRGAAEGEPYHHRSGDHRSGDGRPRGEALPSTGVLETVLQTGLTQSAVQARDDAGWVSVFGPDATGSAVLVPLRVEGEAVGALYLARDQVRLFSHEQLDAVGALADLASVMLRDAQRQVQAREFQLSTIIALGAALEAKDPYTRGHSQRVASNAVALAEALGLPPDEVERIRWASLLHDVGKIAIPEAILRKSGPLSESERAVVAMHPERGANILRAMPPFRPLVDDILHHQEAYDGTGYPAGLAGEAIPLGARIIHVGDTFDALISDRPYRRALSVADALAKLQDMAGTLLDPALVEVFTRLVKERPPFEVQLRLWRER